MVAKVSNLFECPKCKSPMSLEDQKPQRCPKKNCGYRFRKPGEDIATEFSWPRDPAEQYFEMKQVMYEQFLTKPLHEMVPGLSKSDAEMMTLGTEERIKLIEQKLDKDKIQFMLTTQVEDIEGLVKSLHFLMTYAIPSGNRDLVMFLATYGEQIGLMSRVLQEYLKVGGKFHDPTANT